MATYYISPSGSDTTGNGSSGNPWLTLAKAYASSTTSDTIICKDGTYTFATATMSDRTIQAENSGLAIFDGASATALWTLSGISVTGIVFKRFAYNFGYSGLFSYSASVSFSNCTFHSLTVGTVYRAALFYTLTASSALTLTNCLIYNITSSGGGGGLFDVFNSPSGVSVTLTGCAIYLGVTGAARVAVIFILSGSPTVTVKNSIFHNASGGVCTWGGGNTATYSCCYALTSPPTGTGVITSDPKLIDPTNVDFHLAHDSPALGMGTN